MYEPIPPALIWPVITSVPHLPLTATYTVRAAVVVTWAVQP